MKRKQIIRKYQNLIEGLVEMKPVYPELDGFIDGKLNAYQEIIKDLSDE